MQSLRNTALFNLYSFQQANPLRLVYQSAEKKAFERERLLNKATEDHGVRVGTFLLAESFSVSQGKHLLPPTQSKKQCQCLRSQLSVFPFLSYGFIFLSSVSHFKPTLFYVIVTYYCESDEGLLLHHGKSACKGEGVHRDTELSFFIFDLFLQFCADVSMTALANDRNIVRTYVPYSHGGHFPLMSRSGWGSSNVVSGRKIRICQILWKKVKRYT